MKFNLKKPCKDCPFRNDKPHQKGWLGEKRANDIYQNLLDGGNFPCHKTHDYADDSGSEFRHQDNHQFCAGALIMLEKENNTLQSHALRMAIRFDLYNPNDLDKSSPVFENGVSFIKWHGEVEKPTARMAILSIPHDNC